MWYRLAEQGRVVHRIENLEARLKDVISQSLIKRKSGEIHLDFYKLNDFLDDNLRQYVRKIWPVKKSDDLGGYDSKNKILILPYVYNPSVFNTIIHEFVHSIHIKDLPNLKFHDSEKFSDIYSSDLKNTYDEYVKNEWYKYLFYQVSHNDELNKDYNLFLKDKNYITLFDSIIAFFNSEEADKYWDLIKNFKVKLNNDEWKIGKSIQKRVSPEYDLYWATNEEMLAYFENAVQFFNVDNLIAVYNKYYRNNIDGYLSYLRDVFSTISVKKSDQDNYVKFVGLSDKMKDLIEKIVSSTGDAKIGGLDKIVDGKWWKQLAKHITNNFGLLESYLKGQTNERL